MRNCKLMLAWRVPTVEAPAYFDIPPNPAPISRWVIGVSACVAALHLFTIITGGYGYFRDELYYLACADHLQWGYVDHPPLSIAILWLLRQLAGDSLFAVRAVPAACATLLTWGTGAFCARLGGSARAQMLAALAVAAAPLFLGMFGVYSMNALDVLLNSLIIVLLCGLLRRATWAGFLRFGAVVGLAILNKLSSAFLASALLLGLLVSPGRRWIWSNRLKIALACGIAVLLCVPFMIWQRNHDFAMVEFMNHARRFKNADSSFGNFLLEQLLNMNPIALPLWVFGVYYWQRPETRHHSSWISWGFLTLLLFYAFGHGKAYYLASYFPILLVGGALAFDNLLKHAPYLRFYPWLLGLSLPLIAPLALALLPPQQLLAYQNLLGKKPTSNERDAPPPLGQHFGDMFGWGELATQVAQIYHALPAADRADLLIIGDNYGHAGAIDLFGKKLGLPPASSAHNSYFYWMTRKTAPRTFILIGGDIKEYKELFAEVEIAGQFDNPWMRAFERHLPIYVCRGLGVDWLPLWREARNFQ